MSTVKIATDSNRSVQYGNLNFDVWDLGGQTSIRPYWRSYYANTAAVIFVVDSTDIERLEIAADELRSMLNEDELKDAALLVFANKQDQVSHYVYGHGCWLTWYEAWCSRGR